MGRAHLARGHPDLGRASTRRERGNQRDPDDQSTIRHLTSPPLRRGELPLRVSVSRDSTSISSGVRGRVQYDLGPFPSWVWGALRRTHVGTVPYRIRWSWVGSLRRYAKGKIALELRRLTQTEDGGIKGGWRTGTKVA